MYFKLIDLVPDNAIGDASREEVVDGLVLLVTKGERRSGGEPGNVSIEKSEIDSVSLLCMPNIDT